MLCKYSSAVNSASSFRRSGLALGREIVIAVGIALPDLAVAPVYQQLGALVARDLPRPIDRVLLPLVHRRRPLAPLRLYGPAIGVWDNVLMASRRFSWYSSPDLDRLEGGYHGNSQASRMHTV